jgi:diaminohydroxyphosphoribosylaminopyrimidine deaminase / 5-amino-6-(5-phosphoribosylamino)uracil reductase
MFSPADELMMRRALGLAAQGLYTTTPNPRVGCVIVNDGVVVGEGWHERAGQPHAEVLALNQAGPARSKAATAYITLEPCSHFGRTPPCADALIKAGIRQVIVALQDPNPKVSGRGLQSLRDAGIDVRCGLLQEEAAELNLGFIKRMTTGMPWVRAKSAASLDGRTALPSGQSQWITSQAARDDGHAWRARACAVLTGIGTVRKDNPRMDVRAVPTTRQPLKVVVDTRFEIDSNAQLLASGNALVAVCVDLSLPLYREKAQAMRDRGVELVTLPMQGPAGKLDLASLLAALAAREFNEIHVEGGAQLTGAMMRLGLIDEWLLYTAPVFLGEGYPIAAGVGPWSQVEDAPRWRWKEHVMVGDALRSRLVKT